MGMNATGGCQHQPQPQQFDPAKAEGKVDGIKDKLTNDKPSDDKGAMDQLGELLKQVLEALKKEQSKSGGSESDTTKDLKGIEHGIQNAQKAEDPSDELQHLKELLQDMQSAGQVE